MKIYSFAESVDGLPIGTIFLKEMIVSIWDFLEIDIFRFHQDDTEFCLIEGIVTSDTSYNFKRLTKSEITEDIKKILKEKEYSYKN